MLITISGTPGAGKGTVALLLSKQLRLKRYSIGDMFRSMARSKHMSLEEFDAYVNANPNVDRELEAWQGRMAQKLKRGIFEGRVSFYVIPNSIKIFLRCSLDEAARRVWLDNRVHRRHEADLSTRAKAKRALQRRVRSYANRYRRNYRLNIFDPQHYDLVVDTTHDAPRDTLRKILDFLKKVENQGKSSKLSTSRSKKFRKTSKRKKN